MMGIDFTTTATLRPELIDRTFSSFSRNLVDIDLKDCTMYANIDPVPNGNFSMLNDVVDVLKRYFGRVFVNVPTYGNFPKAVQWSWSQTTEELVFHVEDDWELLEPITVENMVSSLGKATSNYVGVNLNAYMFINYMERICLSPVLLKGDWVRKVAPHMKDNYCPEKQLRKYTLEKDRIPVELIGDTLKWPSGWKIVIRDTGRLWRSQRRLKRSHNPDKFTTWTR